DAAAKTVAQFLCARNRAVDDSNIADAALPERVNHGPSSTPSAKHDGWPVPVPARRKFIQIGREAFRIGIAAGQSAIFEPQRVDCPDHFGSGVAPGDRGKGGFLVRYRDVTAHKAAF